jgi:hypothetical protein
MPAIVLSHFLGFIRQFPLSLDGKFPGGVPSAQLPLSDLNTRSGVKLQS